MTSAVFECSILTMAVQNRTPLRLLVFLLEISGEWAYYARHTVLRRHTVQAEASQLKTDEFQ